MQACFIGHRKVEKTKKLVRELKDTMVALVNADVCTFLFGGIGDFDQIALEVATLLKKEHPFIKRVYVRSEYPVISDDYKQYLLTFYDETYFPQKIVNAGRYVYVEKNYLMIDSCDCCVFYYNEQYVPTQKENKNAMLPTKIKASGTQLAYEYAVRRKKRIINLYKAL